MKVEEKKYVGIEYSLTLDSGEEVDCSKPGEPLGFIFGTGQIISGLEDGIQGMEPGEKAKITVEAQDGYGLPREELHREIPRANFPEDLDIEAGMSFEATGPHGPVQFRVKSAGEETVIADFNHPLAGERLHFDVSIVEVREPRAEELASLSSSHECTPSECGSCGGGCG